MDEGGFCREQLGSWPCDTWRQGMLVMDWFGKKIIYSLWAGGWDMEFAEWRCCTWLGVGEVWC